mgnify:CR=1 FL=1
MQRLRRATPLALALFLALVSGAFAGDNENATFSLSSAVSISGVGPGETITLDISAAGLVGVRNIDVTVEVSDPALFDVADIELDINDTVFDDFIGASLPAEVDPAAPAQARVGAAFPASLGDAVAGAGSFRIDIPTSASFTTTTEATVWIALISVGPGPEARDEFNAATLGLTTTVNPPISIPTLAASTGADMTKDFSAVGTGAVADDSDGEATLGVIFRDNTGTVAAGQAITWTINNAGSEDVQVLGAAVTTVGAGQSATVGGVTDAAGAATLVLDAEGGKLAGSTTASITASATADDSDGNSVVSEQDFSVTWDVPVPAELASFAGEVTIDEEVRLEWTVSSQTNNLGWEVFRSTDNEVFERVSPLISGDGTSDVARTFEFVDAGLPAADVAFYYLRQIDLDGSAARSDVIQVSLQKALPLASALMQNYPNPFNPETTIHFDLATGSSVRLRVFDATGQVVRTLVREALPAGSYTEIWDGQNEQGVQVGSGVYFYELRAGAFTSMKKMTLLQ